MRKKRPGPDRWKEQAKYWQSLPAGATATLLGGVFGLFAALGLLTGIVNAPEMTIAHALLQALLAGGFAIVWATAGFRRIIWLLVAMFPIQLAANYALSRLWVGVPALPSTEAGRAELMRRLQTEGILAIVMIIAGYILVVMFIRKEGVRVFGAVTEMRLAGEVHRALVPAFSRTIGGYEVSGISAPSGHVGGDLVDVVQTPNRWVAYVADVTGHGVPAGMIMAMVKSAVHMGSSAETLSALVSDLNRVFSSLAAPNVLATFAGISGGGGPELDFVLAGHLPILHYRKLPGVVEERTVSNLPLGVSPSAKFAGASIVCEPGDVLAVVTDGLTEATDEHEREVGLEPLKAVLLESAGAPLEAIMRGLRGASLEGGTQADDQTVLLVRRL